MRLGKVDYFSVVTRKPAICDFKPVQVEVAIARLFEKKSDGEDSSVQILRFANRVPLQFDKASCAIVKSISSVNWKSYSIKQTKGNLPSGPYIIAVSVVSPFLKFKNASKETIDATDELVTEIRKALMKAGQSLSRHIKKEAKTQELENKIKHIEKFGPVLVNTLCRILGASAAKKKKAEEGIEKILGRDNLKTRQQLDEVEERLNVHLASRRDQFDTFMKEDEELQARQDALLRAEEEILGTRHNEEETSSKKEFSRKKKSSKKK
jgi:DNA topoisomerase-6 subunit B